MNCMLAQSAVLKSQNQCFFRHTALRLKMNITAKLFNITMLVTKLSEKQIHNITFNYKAKIKTVLALLSLNSGK